MFSRHISHLPQTRGLERKIAEGPPCVVLASPGMLQSGMSRELLELWAPDNRNGLIITGYSVEGTMGRVSFILPSLSFIFFLHVCSTWAMKIFQHSVLHKKPVTRPLLSSCSSSDSL